MILKYHGISYQRAALAVNQPQKQGERVWRHVHYVLPGTTENKEGTVLQFPQQIDEQLAA